MILLLEDGIAALTLALSLLLIVDADGMAAVQNDAQDNLPACALCCRSVTDSHRISSAFLMTASQMR